METYYLAKILPVLFIDAYGRVCLLIPLFDCSHDVTHLKIILADAGFQNVGNFYYE